MTQDSADSSGTLCCLLDCISRSFPFRVSRSIQIISLCSVRRLASAKGPHSHRGPRNIFFREKSSSSSSWSLIEKETFLIGPRRKRCADDWTRQQQQSTATLSFLSRFSRVRFGVWHADCGPMKMSDLTVL